ncbi:MAG: omega-6 fatty acid desaturase (delta-12 desaturase) [Dinoroseobacter sp.]|jgi:omega-6 fatty acid desaturase (delta-12 desaturase)
MNQTPDFTRAQPVTRDARDWVKILAAYREPNEWRSAFELAISFGPFVALWALAWWSMSISYWLTFGLSVLASGFLLRMFTIQHDCGHGSLFKNRVVSDWVGRVLGVFTLTPYDVWRRTHSMHHASSGDLGRRGMGDVHTLTLAEYNARSPFQQLLYRMYRHPITLFVLGPGYLFLLQNRMPLGLMGDAKYWVSAGGTNAALASALGLVWYFGGWAAIVLIFLPSSLIAATAGVWLFYIQHQFEETRWEQSEDWQLHDSALHGSSHYALPKPLQWMTANIGIHHVHHLYSRIPFYRLPQVLRDHEELATGTRMTVRESFACARLHLWDEKSKRLMSFAQAHSASA